MSATTPFSDRLDAAVRQTSSVCLLGLDPHLDLLPEAFAVARDRSAPRATRARAIADFCCELVDLAAGRVPAVKPQSAFFELFGADGALAWEQVVEHARSRGLLVVGDLKRGDIASTAKAYALAHLADSGRDGRGRVDAMTLSPYLGSDTLEPFVEVAREQHAGLFVLVRTSNPGSGRYQAEGEPGLAARVADDVTRLGESVLGRCGLSSIGAVVGATHAGELARWRAALPKAWLLLPGYGAQGATAADVAEAFLAGGSGALVASSRAVAFAYREKGAPAHWREAADLALARMSEDLGAVLAARA